MTSWDLNQSAESSNRIAYYRRGYGDGAKGSAHKYAMNVDYMRGYNSGVADAAKSTRAFCEHNNLPVPGVIR